MVVEFSKPFISETSKFHVMTKTRIPFGTTMYEFNQGIEFFIGKEEILKKYKCNPTQFICLVFIFISLNSPYGDAFSFFISRV